MRFAVTVKAIMSLNLNAFCLTGDPDAIYRFLTAELLECEPADLLMLHDLLKRELTNETDTSSSGLNALTKRFFSGLRDVLYGILAERIHEFKDANDFLPLGQLIAQALQANPNMFHEVSQIVYHDSHIPEILERANNSTMYTYHAKIEEHFRKIRENVREIEEQGADGTLDGYPNRNQSVLSERRLLNLLDVVSCYNDASLMRAAPSDSAIKMEDE